MVRHHREIAPALLSRPAPRLQSRALEEPRKRGAPRLQALSSGQQAAWSLVWTAQVGAARFQS
eukprot:1979347-Alexandrium_andersonii.AAC.1